MGFSPQIAGGESPNSFSTQWNSFGESPGTFLAAVIGLPMDLAIYSCRKAYMGSTWLARRAGK